MMPLTLRSVSVIVLLCLNLWVGTACAQTSVTVSIDVRRDDGQPLASVPIETSSDTQRRFDLTDATGHLSVPLLVGDGDKEIGVRLWSGFSYSLDPVVRDLAEHNYLDYTSTYALQAHYGQAVEAEKTAYHFQIDAHDAIRVTARVRQDAPVDSAVMLAVYRGAWVGRGKIGDIVVFRGVRKGLPGELGICASSPLNMLVRLTAEQTQADIDIGEIHVPAIVETTPLTFVLQNAANVCGPESTSLWYAVTLISTDGETILSYALDADGRARKRVRTRLPKEDPSIPTGTYYVAPGGPDTKLPAEVLRLVREGNLAALEIHNVPKIVAVSQPVSLSVDCAQVRDAIVAAGGG